MEEWRRQMKEHKSAGFKPVSWKKLADPSYKKEISSKYTIAPAYNKGAYQVISKDNIKDIGK